MTATLKLLDQIQRSGPPIHGIVKRYMKLAKMKFVKGGPSKGDLEHAVFACGREDDMRLHTPRFYLATGNKPFDVEIIGVQKRGEEASGKGPNIFVDTRDCWKICGYLLQDGKRALWVELDYSTRSRTGTAWGFKLTKQQLADQGYPDWPNRRKYAEEAAAIDALAA